MAIFDYNPSAITPFPYWRWNKVLPAVYDDSLSQYEMLCKLLSVVNNIISSTNSTGEQVEALTQLVQQLINGEYPSGIVEYVTQIVDAAMADDIEHINEILDNMETQIAALGDKDYLLSVVRQNSSVNPYLFECFYSYYKNNGNLKYMENNTVDGTATRYTLTDGLFSYAYLNKSADNRFYIDCNTLIELCLLGVPYESSRYAGNAENISSLPYTIPFENANNIALQYYTFQNNEALKELMGSDVGVGRWAANQMALWFYNHDALFEIEDYRQLQFGDIIFKQDVDPTYGEQYGYWRGINHVSIYLGHQETSCVVGDCINGQNADRDNGPIFIRRVNESVFNKNNHPRFIYAYRPQINVPVKSVDAISPSTYSVNTTAYTEPTVIHRFNCDIKENEIAFVNIEGSSNSLYLSIVPDSMPNKPIVLRLDRDNKNTIICERGNITQLVFYAVPMNGAGSLTIDSIKVIKYNGDELLPNSIRPYVDSSITADNLIAKINTQVAIQSPPSTFDIFIPYAQSNEIGGIAGTVGNTTIHVIASNMTNWIATAYIQSGTTVTTKTNVRSAGTYSGWL